MKSRQYNQYRRPSVPVQLLEGDGEESRRGYSESPEEESRVYGGSSEEGYGERVVEKWMEVPSFSEHGETVEDGIRDNTAPSCSRSQEEQVNNVVVDE